jgi:signal transduction histidine kinase
MKVFLFCLYVISAIPVLSQVSEVDSLSSLITACQPLDGDSCQTIVQNIIESVKDNSDERLYPAVLISAGIAYYDIGDFEKAEQLLLEAKTISDSLGATILIANANKPLGMIVGKRGDFEQSLSYYLNAAKIWEESGDKRELAEVYLGISSVFFDIERLSKSQYYDNLVKGIAEDLDDDRLRLKAGANTALSSMTFGINYYLQNQQDTLNFQRTLDTLDFYFKKSEVEYYEGLDLAKKIGSQEVELKLLNNLVALTMNMENNEKALKLAKESEILAEALGVVDLIIQSKVNIGSAYRRMGKLDMAAKYGEESLSLAKKHGFERKEYIANRTLYELYKTIGNYSQANLVLEEIRMYDKKVGDIERNKDIAELESKYQNSKKEKKILLQRNSILELAAENVRIEKQREYILGGSAGLLFLGFFGFQFNRIKKDRNDKITFAEALIYTQEEERKRIGRDLHDGIGQSLLLIKKQVLATKETTEENRKLITETLEEVRSISRDLHPFQLKQFGLTAALKDMLSRVEKSSGLFISKELPDLDGLLTEKSEIHVYRTIQEALNNAVKHAQATAVRIACDISEREIVITVKDNGIGFENKKKNAPSKSLGLRTMSERMASIGGKLIVASVLSKGTTITLHIPKS